MNEATNDGIIHEGIWIRHFGKRSVGMIDLAEAGRCGHELVHEERVLVEIGLDQIGMDGFEMQKCVASLELGGDWVVGVMRGKWFLVLQSFSEMLLWGE